MRIAVAGPYSAPTEAERKRNLEHMNEVAARLLESGHIPVIGINAALPVLEKARLPVSGGQTTVTDHYKAIMEISLAAVSACDGLLLLAESPGANKERDLILSQGKPVFSSIDEILTYASGK